MESTFGVTGNKIKVNTKCAGLGGNSSSIAAKKLKPTPKKPTTDIFKAKTYFIYPLTKTLELFPVPSLKSVTIEEICPLLLISLGLKEK